MLLRHLLFCLHSATEILTNCYEYKYAEYNATGNYLVDPGDEDPFPGKVNMDTGHLTKRYFRFHRIMIECPWIRFCILTRNTSVSLP